MNDPRLLKGDELLEQIRSFLSDYSIEATTHDEAKFDEIAAELRPGTRVVWAVDVGRCINPRGLEAGSVWPSFYFGLLPGETGQFDGARLFDPALYDHVSYRPEADRAPQIGTTLTRASSTCGKTVGSTESCACPGRFNPPNSAAIARRKRRNPPARLVEPDRLNNACQLSK